MDIDEAAAELYGGPPEVFTARRSELAAAAKKAGDAAAAKDIGRLRRPTVSAWCLNVLVAERDDVLAEVFEVAERLRRAQAALDAARMGELSTRRRALVGQVQRRASEVARGAGQALSAAAQREVEETLAAVVASEDAARAVASGRLTRSLSYAGFGDVDLSGATATPLRSVPPAGEATRRGKPQGSRQRADAEPEGGDTGGAASAPDLRLVPTGRAAAAKAPPRRTAADRAAQAAAEAKAAAAAQVEEARAAVETSAQALAEANRRGEEAAATVRRLQDELAQARADAAAAARAVATAERRHASAEVTLGNAERRLRSTPGHRR